jgi:uncharacterized protein YggT (Ycf19 family)
VVLTDFILNLAALLLWLSWRSRQFDPLVRTVPATLVGTLRPAEPRRFKGGELLAGLAVLLVLRGLLYVEIGSPADWTPKLNLGLIVLAFRSDSFSSVLLYSVLSFLRVFLIFYFWLLILALLNRSAADSDAVPRMLRLHLGPPARWPWPWQLVLPVMVIAALWAALYPPLLYLDVVTRVHSTVLLAAQGLVLGLSVFFTLKYLLPVFLFLHLISSYVFLGRNPVWDFVSSTARSLLSPLRRVPLQFAQLDFAPVAGVVLLFLLLHWLPNFILATLAKWNLTLWPQ